MGLAEFGLIIRNEVGDIGGVLFPQIVSEIQGKRNITSERFDSPGVDAAPLPGDNSLLVPVQRSGGAASAGVIDTKNGPEALPGERRTYGRSSDGTITSEIWQRNDGTVEVKNDNGTIVIDPDGTMNLTNEGIQMKLGVDGTVELTATKVVWTVPEVEISGTVTAEDFIIPSGVTLKDHKTSLVTPGVGTSGPPVP